MSDQADDSYPLTDRVYAVELASEVFVYRERDGEQRYVCKPCLDSGVKAILSREESVAVIRLVCSHCGSAFVERRKPLSGLAMSPWG